MSNLSFNLLIESINQVHRSFQSQSVKAVNTGLTLRNWCIGFYIVEFEQNGEDRAKYGTTLVANIAKSIKIKGLTAPELSRCRQFYRVYPEILGAKTQELIRNITNGKTTKQILGLTTQELQSSESQLISSISYTANEKDRLFVSKYKLKLPSEQDLKMFIERELQGIDRGEA
jgi:hypothetical protein